MLLTYCLQEGVADSTVLLRKFKCFTRERRVRPACDCLLFDYTGKNLIQISNVDKFLFNLVSAVKNF